jgi:hypothetical protein
MINNTSKTDISLRAEAIAGQLSRPLATSAKATETDRLSSASQDTLLAALNEQPEVRPEEVERGHQLLAAGNYPPTEIIRRLTEMIVASNDLSE